MVTSLQLASPPRNFDHLCEQLTRQGARVLALGHRSLGVLSAQELRETRRDAVEQRLTFAGFVVISCPLKPDSRAILHEIQNSSHSVSALLYLYRPSRVV